MNFYLIIYSFTIITYLFILRDKFASLRNDVNSNDNDNDNNNHTNANKSNGNDNESQPAVLSYC